MPLRSRSEDRSQTPLDTSAKGRDIIPYAALAVFLALLTFTKSSDFDIFFHMRVGELIVQNKSLSLGDTISYTAEGAKVFTGDWIGKAALYLAYSAGGWHGLAALKAAFFLCIMYLVFRQMVCLAGGQASAGLIVLSIAVAALAMRFRLSLRPYYFSFVFLSAYLALFYAWRAGKARRLIFVIPLLQLIWANSHSSSVMGAGLAALFFLTEAVRTKRPEPALGIVCLLAFIAGGISPSGFGVYGILKGFVPFAGGPAGGGAFNISMVDEWMPLDAEMLWGHGLKYTFWFQTLVLGAGLYHVRRLVRRRSLDLFGLVLFAGSVYYALRHMRFVDLASLCLAAMFFGFLSDISGESDAPSSRGRTAEIRRFIAAYSGAISAVIIAALCVPVVFMSRTYDFGIGPKEGVYPDAGVGFLRENNIKSRGFNTIPAGSYISFSAPEIKVFIDGRLSYPSDFITKYYFSLKSAEAFAELDRQYGFSFVIAEYGSRPTWKFPSHLGENPDWTLVQWDRAGAVWVRRLPENEGLIKRFGYRAAYPAFDRFDYLDKRMGRGTALLSDLDWDIALNPAIQEPHMAKAYAAYYLGRRDAAERELRIALGMEPDTSFEHTALAVLLLESGDREGARAEALKALIINPFNEDAKKIIGAY